MLFNNFVAAAFLAFASVGITSPVPATGDISVADTNPLIAARQRVGRRKFTQDVAARTAAAFPGRGVVVCNVGFKTTGTVVQQTTVRYNAKLGTTVTFEVVVLGAGASFTRQGDGGFENWAYSIPGSCRVNRETISC
ncbi:hypothetical protein HYQ46_007646 [Verticillium longisporum]|nr:hypothetical protein HYQ46_007646 [Verticillium longisporum]